MICIMGLASHLLCPSLQIMHPSLLLQWQCLWVNVSLLQWQLHHQTHIHIMFGWHWLLTYHVLWCFAVLPHHYTTFIVSITHALALTNNTMSLLTHNQLPKNWWIIRHQVYSLYLYCVNSEWPEWSKISSNSPCTNATNHSKSLHTIFHRGTMSVYNSFIPVGNILPIYGKIILYTLTTTLSYWFR